MRFNHHQGAHYSCLLKLQLLKQSIKIHRCVVNTVVVWLQPPKHIGAVLMQILILFLRQLTSASVGE
jgi:hypothetical protein